MLTPQVRRDLTMLAAGAAILATGYGIARVQAEGAPTKQPLFYAGTLEEDGIAPTGRRVVGLELWNDGIAGAPICAKVVAPVDVVAGRFRMELGDACTNALRSSPETWVAVSFGELDGTERAIAGRAKIGATPFALQADHAVTATTATTAMTAGSAMKAESANTCATAAALSLTNPTVVGAPTEGSINANDVKTVNLTLGGGATYLLSATLFGASMDVHKTYLVHSPHTPNLNVQIKELLAADYNLGDIQVRAQNDAAAAENWAYNDASNYLLRLTFTAGSSNGLSWRYTLTQIN